MHHRRRLSILLGASLLISVGPVVADSGTFDRALKRYYDGYPSAAIAMIEPLAIAGDVEAQYLLANILYSLSNSGLLDANDDAVEWYRRAAAQGSADAKFALGVIYDNRWRRSRNPRDAASAIVLYREATNQGHARASSALGSLRARSGMTDKAALELLNMQPDEATARVKAPTLPPPNPVPVVAADDQPTATAATDEAEPETTADPAATPPAPPAIAENDGPVVAADDQPTGTATPPAIAENDGPAITLGYVADRCEEYTQAGFDLYADSIRGARLTGRASIVSIEADSTERGTYRIGFAEKRPNVSLRVELGRVPERVAQRFTRGARAAVSGIIAESEAAAAGCSIRLEYRPVAG